MERPEVDWPQESLDLSTGIPLIVLFISQLCFFMHAGFLGGAGCLHLAGNMSTSSLSLQLIPWPERKEEFLFLTQWEQSQGKTLIGWAWTSQYGQERGALPLADVGHMSLLWPQVRQIHYYKKGKNHTDDDTSGRIVSWGVTPASIFFFLFYWGIIDI